MFGVFKKTNTLGVILGVFEKASTANIGISLIYNKNTFLLKKHSYLI